MTEDEFITKLFLKGIHLERDPIPSSKKYETRIWEKGFRLYMLTYRNSLGINVKIKRSRLKHFKTFDAVYRELIKQDFFK